MNTAEKIQPQDIELPPPGGKAVQIIGPETGTTAIVPDSTTILQMIERASRDQTVDVVKLKELAALYERMEDRARERDFDIAMNEAQHGMAQIRADAQNPQTQSKYASYSALDKVLRPIYTAHGFSLSFNTAKTDTPETLLVTCRVSKGGYSRDYEIPMPADGKGAKGGDVMTKTHATGSAFSYGRRYLLSGIFNIAIDRDDDGNAASTTAITEEQVDELRVIITDLDAELKPIGVHVDIAKLCKNVGVKTIEEIPSRKYAMLVRSLKQWAATELKKRKPKK